MKRILILLLALAGLCYAADPILPDNITLSNGVTLRGISVVRWNTDSVVIKHAGGVDPIRFSIIPSATLELLKATKKAAASDASKGLTLSGEVFVTTNGRQNVKLASADVKIFKGNLKSSLQSSLKEAVDAVRSESGSFAGPDTLNAKLDARRKEIIASLGEPITSGITDSEGRFSVGYTGAGDYSLIVFESRMVGDGMEKYFWAIPSAEIKDPSRIILANQNILAY